MRACHCPVSSSVFYCGARVLIGLIPRMPFECLSQLLSNGIIWLPRAVVTKHFLVCLFVIKTFLAFTHRVYVFNIKNYIQALSILIESSFWE